MKTDSIYQNYPQKHLILNKHNKKIPEVLRVKSNSLYLPSVSCEANSITQKFLFKVYSIICY